MGYTLNDIKNSKYLTKEDAGEVGLNLTISHVTMEMLENDDKKEQKLVLHWLERTPDGNPVKPMICNVENFQRISTITGNDDTDGWTSARVNVFNDPFVSFGTRQTGGLRVRQPTDQPNAAEQYRQQQAPQSMEQGMSAYEYSQRMENPSMARTQTIPAPDESGIPFE